MLQKDISDLEQSQVDWKHGKITRKRTKTKRYERVPKVTYKLWPVTFELLKRYRSDGKFVLVNESGNQLVRDEISSEGKYKKSDNIKNAFARLLRKAGVKGSFKLLRKTSSSLLHNNKEQMQFVQLFLAHAPSSVAEKHYVSTDGDALDGAIDFLWQSLKSSIQPSESDELLAPLEQAVQNNELVVDLVGKQIFWLGTKFEGKLPSKSWEFFSVLVEAHKSWDRGIAAEDVGVSPRAFKSQKKRVIDVLAIQFPDLAKLIESDDGTYRLRVAKEKVAVYSRSVEEKIHELVSATTVEPISIDTK